jgi:hypothetical protein
VYWARRSSGNDLGGGFGFHRQAVDGIHPGNGSSNHPPVYPRAAWQLAPDLRRGNLRGLALKTYTSGEYRFAQGQLKRSKKLVAIRGLNANRNHDLKNLFKGAATYRE